MYKLNCGLVRCVVGVTVLLVFTARSRVGCLYSVMLVSGPVASVWTVYVFLHGACCFCVPCVRCRSFLSCSAVFIVLCFWSWRPVFNVLPFPLLM